MFSSTDFSPGIKKKMQSNISEFKFFAGNCFALDHERVVEVQVWDDVANIFCIERMLVDHEVFTGW